LAVSFALLLANRLTWYLIFPKQDRLSFLAAYSLAFRSDEISGINSHPRKLSPVGDSSVKIVFATVEDEYQHDDQAD
jgi:hypothetical protein